MNNNFAIESFIEYCDSMMIANEAKINIGETIKKIIDKIIKALKNLGDKIRKSMEKLKEKYKEKTTFIDQYGTFEIISKNMGFLNTTTDLCVNLTNTIMNIKHPDSLDTYDRPLEKCQDMCDELKEKVEFGEQLREKLSETRSNREKVSNKEFKLNEVVKLNKILYDNMTKLLKLTSTLRGQDDFQDMLGNHTRAQILTKTFSLIQKFVLIMTTFENLSHVSFYDGTIDNMMGEKK